MLLEDYGLISNMESAALVGRNGSIDWLCLPRFDSAACFAALLGDESHGRWLIAPSGEVRRVTRRYRPGTLVLETDFETDDGVVRVIDCMPPGDGAVHVVRLVEGLSGSVPMRMDLVIRLDYGSTVPWVTSQDGQTIATAGPDSLRLATPIETRGENFKTLASFTIREGERVPFLLDWHAGHTVAPYPLDAFHAVARAQRLWEEWSARCTYTGEWRDAVLTSLLVLKGLTHTATGGIVAAPTTSLPEALGKSRNWDYRYCWVRDAVLTLGALVHSGYTQEGLAFADWLFRASAGHPADAQIMYGLGGERRLAEYEVDWLPGYEGSTPVNVGNAAAGQFQLDVYGELADAFLLGRTTLTALGKPPPEALVRVRWRRFLAMMEFLEDAWHEPDEGIWEVRGPRRHFTHSKVLAWTAFDRAVKQAEAFEPDSPIDRWRQQRDMIHEQVCREGYDAERGTFTQYYGSGELDASVLLIPALGFLPPDDERVVSTIEVIRRELTQDGFVYRYLTGTSGGDVDGLEGKEGAFLPCSFWLVDAMAMAGQLEEARELFEQLLAIRNDLGLLSEEYDVDRGRLIGNFPQAFTHLALVRSALLLDALANGSAQQLRPALAGAHAASGS